MLNPVQQFFSCTANGDISGALELINDNVVFEAQGPSTVPIYGQFQGKDGVRRFIRIASEMFEKEIFEFRKWAEAENYVFAYGFLQHRVRKSGRIFKSEWALVCQIENGKIISYKMFEDTAALQAAYS